MKRRAVEIARGDKQNEADKKKQELHRLDGESGPPVGKESCRITGSTVASRVPGQVFIFRFWVWVWVWFWFWFRRFFAVWEIVRMVNVVRSKMLRAETQSTFLLEMEMEMH